ncbi:MAG: retropepsin-like aspartic protease [Gemmatimonadota bacterium]
MRPIRRISWLAVIMAGCHAGEPERVEAPADAEAGTIAIEWAGANQAALLVPVHINGNGPYRFVLDTGATLTCVENELAAELELPEPAGQIAVGAGVAEASQMRLVTIDSLRVGEARAEGLPACAIDLGAAGRIGLELDGLLGLNFLRSFHLEIDFENDQVILE